jgi:hypothetical protein
MYSEHCGVLFSVDLFLQYIPLNYWKSNFTESIFTSSVSFVLEQAKTWVSATASAGRHSVKWTWKITHAPPFILFIERYTTLNQGIRHKGLITYELSLQLFLINSFYVTNQISRSAYSAMCWKYKLLPSIDTSTELSALCMHESYKQWWKHTNKWNSKKQEVLIKATTKFVFFRAILADSSGKASDFGMCLVRISMGYQLFWLMFFVMFLSSTRKNAGTYLKLDHYRFLPHPFQFITHYNSTIRCYIIWVTVRIKIVRNYLDF